MTSLLTDFNKLWDHFCVKPFSGKMIGLSKVPLTEYLELHHVEDANVGSALRPYQVVNIHFVGDVAIIKPLSRDGASLIC